MSKVSVRVLIAALMVAVLLALAGPAFAQEADEWSQFQKDKANSGCMDCKVPESGKASEVTKAVDARDGSQPVVSGSNLFVYTGVDDTSGSVICYDMTDWEKVWETDTLGAGLHTVKIEWTGTKSAAATDTNINVDAVDVTGTLD